MDYTKNFLELVEKNPGLPIIPIVNGNVTQDAWYYWLGSFNRSTVDKVVLSWNNTVLFKSDDDVEETLDKYYNDEEYNALPDDDAERRKVYENLPWKQIIVVYIEQNEDEIFN